MACKEYNELIDKYIEGLITNEEKTALTKHIKKCENCHRELVELGEILQATKALEMKELPLDFTQQLKIKLEEASCKNRPQRQYLPIIGFLKDLQKFLCNIYFNIKKTSYWKAVLSLCIIGLFIVFVFRPYGSVFTKKQIADSVSNDMEEGSPMIAENEMPKSGIDLKRESFSETPINNIKSKAIEKKIIKNADISIYVEDFSKTLEKALFLAEELGGYIERSLEEGVEGDSQRRANIVMRVPQEKLTKALELIKSLGKVKSQQLSGDDITEEYYDTTTRAENLKQQEKRLLEILKKAKDVDEILKIEKELNRVRTDIDIITGQIMTWDKMTEYSLINLNLIEKVPSKGSIKNISINTFIEKASIGFTKGINFFIKILMIFSEILGALIVLFILVGIILFIRKTYKKHKK